MVVPFEIPVLDIRPGETVTFGMTSYFKGYYVGLSFFGCDLGLFMMAFFTNLGTKVGARD